MSDIVLTENSEAQHPDQWVAFRRASGRGRLAHGYLFIGPRTARMQEFAKAFAQCLLCEQSDEAELTACGKCARCRQVAANTNPDFLSVGLPPGKNELPVELLLGSGERRGKEGLCYELSLTPTMGTRRIAVLNDADTMNVSSANALLKTLEEPPAGSVLILIAQDSNRILPTIHSRCQTVYFPPANCTAESTSDEDTSDELVAPEQSQRIASIVRQHLSKRDFNRIPLFADVSSWLDEIGGDSATQRKLAREILKACAAFLSGRITSLSETGDTQALEMTVEMLDRTMVAEEHLDHQMPIPLCLEGLFDAFAKLRRQSAA